MSGYYTGNRPALRTYDMSVKDNRVLPLFATDGQGAYVERFEAETLLRSAWNKLAALDYLWCPDHGWYRDDFLEPGCEECRAEAEEEATP